MSCCLIPSNTVKIVTLLLIWGCFSGVGGSVCFCFGFLILHFHVLLSKHLFIGIMRLIYHCSLSPLSRHHFVGVNNWNNRNRPWNNNRNGWNNNRNRWNNNRNGWNNGWNANNRPWWPGRKCSLTTMRDYT